MPFSNVKTLEAFIHVVVNQEDTLLGMELELVGVDGSKIGPTRATKGA
jgi:hypothetical protein